MSLDKEQAMFRCLIALLVVNTFTTDVFAADPIDIGTRCELLVDDYLIDSLSGAAKQAVQQPVPKEVVLVTDKPWEGNTCAYYTIFEDGDLYRMYYRGSHWNTETKTSTHPEVTCYAESRDGIHWAKPNLGLFEFEGSKENNIVWEGIGTHCFAPFKDENPACEPDARYKALSRGRPVGKKGLYAFKSPDAIHWSLMKDEPVITEGAFDSQNIAFWDVHSKIYRAYHRDFRKVRDIKWEVSDDFLNWSDPEFLNYGDHPLEHLYTNAIQNAPRAPHILIGFPTRFLPDEGQRVEPTFMSSRDGHTFYRWYEPVIPESAPEDRGGNRSNYMTRGILDLASEPDSYSIYATEAYYTGPDSRVRRFVYRKDAYVAIDSEGAGEMLTKPLLFAGKSLSINILTKPKGSVRVELLKGNGDSIPWFTSKDCDPLSGDKIDVQVAWKEYSLLEKLAGKPIRLKFVLKDAQLFSFQFQE
jgi:hypothetical protein